MPFQAVPDTAEAQIRCDVAGNQMENRLNFSKAGGYDLSALQDLADAVAGIVVSGYKPLLHTNVTYNETFVRGLAHDPDQSTQNVTGAGAGTASGNLVPTNCSLCVTFRTGFGGRSFRGRFYTLPTGDSNLSGIDQYASGYAAAVVAMLEDIQIAASGVGWSLGIVSRRHAGVLRPTGIITRVSAIETRNRLIDSQRGRLTHPH